MASKKGNPFGGKQANPFGKPAADGKDTSGKKTGGIKAGKRSKGGM